MDRQMKQEKDRLRQTLLELTESLPEDYIVRSDRSMYDTLLELDTWEQVQAVFIYVSTKREPQTRGMIQAALDAGKTVAVPRTLTGGEMEARVIASLDDLQPGRLGIPEPAATLPLLLSKDIDLVVAPCIAADRLGYRLGHGGGYYDRYLANVRCITACLCRERLLQSKLPHDAFDIPMDIVVTEKSRINCR